MDEPRRMVDRPDPDIRQMVDVPDPNDRRGSDHQPRPARPEPPQRPPVTPPAKK